VHVPLWFSGLGLALGLVGAVLATASLAVLATASRPQLRHLADEGIGPARRLLVLTEYPQSVSAALAAATALLGAVALLSAVALARAPEAPPAAEPVVLVAAVVGLLGSQAVAWAAVIGRAEQVGLTLTRMRVIQTLTAVFRPPVGLLAERLARALSGGAPTIDPGRRELQMLVEVVEENGTLEAGEQRMIHGIVELGDRTVREVMVPRVDMVAVGQHVAVRELLERIRASGHSRIPVYGESVDDVIGIVYAKDLLQRMPAMSLDAPVGPLVRPARFVPETKRVDELLHEMQDMKVHMAVVVDEYGGTAGLITIEDLLEEIVGEIRDEYDIGEEPWIERLTDREAVFDARVSIHDVNQTLPLDLDDTEYDTLGGLVYARLGKVPAQGDEVRVDDAVVRVLSTAGRRIRKVRVAIEPPSANAIEA
jgi:CBS domain containing-hemolysin-like protein